MHHLQPFCYHWTSVEGWRVNCYLKSGESAVAERLEEATSGSVGVRCLPGATSLKAIAGPAGTPGSPAGTSLGRCSYDVCKILFSPALLKSDIHGSAKLQCPGC